MNYYPIPIIQSFIHSSNQLVSVGSVVVAVNPRYFRPTEVELLIGYPEKAKKVLGWKAETKLENLVKIMVKSDLEKANNLQ